VVPEPGTGLCVDLGSMSTSLQGITLRIVVGPTWRSGIRWP
jgi:hypothetical protein